MTDIEYSGSQDAPPAKQLKSEHSNGGGGARYGLDTFLMRDDDKLPPNHIVLISITNVQYPVNVEVIYKICATVGAIRKIVCFERNNIVQAMVEFQTLESADKARTSLHGCDVYDNCCTMKVEYSKLNELTVRENNMYSWDFIDKYSEPMDRRKVILNRPPGNAGGPGQSAGGNMYNSGGAQYGGRNSGQGNGNSMGMGNMNASNPMHSGGNSGGQRSINGDADLMNMVQKQLAAQGANMGRPPLGANNGLSMDRDGGDGGTCVLMAYGLDSEKWDTIKIFNILCLYGNVNKVYFMKNKEGTAMIEMSDPVFADNVVRFVGEMNLLGDKVKFNHSKKHIRLTQTPIEYDLPNGTSSIRNFFREKNMNRFVREDQARKNRMMYPTKVLHFFNADRVADNELIQLFKEAGAPEPINIKWNEPKEGARGGFTGLLYFESSADATNGLVLMNHTNIGDRNTKMGFSPAKW